MFKEIKLSRLDRRVFLVPGYPVVYFPHEDLVVFSDLHLGFEEAVARGLTYESRGGHGSIGMFIPRIQFRNIVSMLERVLSIVKPKRILINGDVKHAFDRLLKQEKLEVSRLIEFLYSKNVSDILVIRGNHDNFLLPVLKKYGLKLMIEYVIESSGFKILFTHGHLDTCIEGYDLVVMGHEHPRLKCFGIHKLPSVLVIPTIYGNEILVLPASGAYHPGTAISTYRELYLSPIVKKYGVLESTRVLSWIHVKSIDGLDKDVLADKKTLYGDEFEFSFFEISGELVSVLEFSSIELAMNACGL